MTKSERLYLQNEVEVELFGGIATIKIIDNIRNKNLRYVATNFDQLCNGKEVDVDIYEDKETHELLGFVEF